MATKETYWKGQLQKRGGGGTWGGHWEKKINVEGVFQVYRTYPKISGEQEVAE